jgi:hypothetical protein
VTSFDASIGNFISCHVIATKDWTIFNNLERRMSINEIPRRIVKEIERLAKEPGKNLNFFKLLTFLESSSFQAFPSQSISICN